MSLCRIGFKVAEPDHDALVAVVSPQRLGILQASHLHVIILDALDDFTELQVTGQFQTKETRHSKDCCI